MRLSETSIVTTLTNNETMFKGPIASALDLSPFTDESHIHNDDHPHLVFLDKPLKISQENNNSNDPYPWLDKEDPHRNMTAMEVLKLKVKLHDSILNKKKIFIK